MKVYVVSEGVAHEGSVVRGVYLVRDTALKQVPMNLSQDLRGRHTPGRWWKDGVDYIAIEEFELVCTLEELTAACEAKKIEAFMEANVNEARIKQLAEILNCTRDKAISLLQEHS